MTAEYPNNDILVSPEWVEEHLSDENLILVDTPWKADAFPRAHLPGALCRPGHSYLKQLDEDGENGLHVFSQEAFIEMLSCLGIRKGDEVVVYDDYYSLFATRFWWVCRYFGFDQVKVMNGGWQAWVEKNNPISVEVRDPEEGTDIVVSPRSDSCIRLDEYLELCEGGKCVTWDTRTIAEYNGQDKKGNLRGGHIPGALHLEWKDVLTDEPYPGGSRSIRSGNELKTILTNRGLNKEDLLVTHCQAGIRGAFASFVLELMGYPQHRLYDASMAEWADLEHTPLEI